MAVEAQQMKFFPSQILADREVINTQMEYGVPICSPMADQILPPFYHQQSMNKSESGLTYNVVNYNNNFGSRKRIRDSINDFDAYNSTASQKHRFSSGDGDVLFQLQQQQSDLNSLIAEHTEKIRLELQERRKRQLQTILTTAQEEVMRKLKEKDDEIQRMGKLNWVLQERVKSLYVENQIWRDLAQTNEATANSLRSNLEQVLAHVSTDDNNHHHHHGHVSNGGGGVEIADDAESSCGSNDDDYRRSRGKEVLKNGWQSRRRGAAADGGGMCKKCGEKESSVLILPCRHLCMCSGCGSNLMGNCPVCDSVMNASIHVNI